MSVVYLPAIKERSDDYEAIEKAIKLLFKKEIYLPLLREFASPGLALRNALPSLLEAIRTGQITFNRGIFSGRLNSAISKDLRSLGARFDRKQGCYRISQSSLPLEVRNAISASESRFEEKLSEIDEKLASIVPEALAEKLKTGNLFERALWRIEHDFQRSVRGITIAPKLTREQSARLSAEWSNNLQLWIKDFSQSEIRELRTNMQATVFAGNRYASAVKTIQDSYGVTANKAKFLARQETSLLMAKFKQTRYEAAGVNYYKWGCVAGSKLHPVRPLHKKNEGKVFRWDTPPTVNEQGDRKNPQQDYNCRCFARPMVGYREK